MGAMTSPEGRGVYGWGGDKSDPASQPPPVTKDRLLFWWTNVQPCWVCTDTLYDLLAKGSISSLKIGRRRLISRQAMEHFIRANEQGGADGD